MLIRLFFSDSEEFAYSWVYDISAGGITFDVLRDATVGQPLEFQLKAGSAGRFDLRAGVVRVAVGDGLCRIACRFEEPLPPERLRAVVCQFCAGRGGPDEEGAAGL